MRLIVTTIPHLLALGVALIQPMWYNHALPPLSE